MSKFEETDKKILKAFAILLEEHKTVKSITVSSLARAAEITRATFYAHYDNLHDVSEAYEKQMLKMLDFGNLNAVSMREVEKYFDRLFDFLAENEEIYRHLVMSDVAFAHLQGVNRKFCDRLLADLREIVPRRRWRELELDVRFFVDGAVYTITRYLRNEMPGSLAEIKKYLLGRFRILVPMK